MHKATTKEPKIFRLTTFFAATRGQTRGKKRSH